MQDKTTNLLTIMAWTLALALIVSGCPDEEETSYWDNIPDDDDDDDNTDDDDDDNSDDDDDDNSDDDDGGCEGGGDASQPFGNHAFDYAQGSITPDNWSQSQLDDEVRDYYNLWKSRYLESGCGSGRYYVATGMANSLTVSEAHGYGMIITAYMAGHDNQARTIFDGMFDYFKDHPSSGAPGLMAWSQNYACNNNEGGDSATDGDLDIAYALLLADKQWGSDGAVDYHAEAMQLLDAIIQHEVDNSDSYMLLGDWTSPGNAELYNATRSSDFMPGHLTAFADADPGNNWEQIQDETYDVMESVQNNYSPNTGLLPDFVLYPGGSPHPADSYFLETAYDGEYFYNSCRVPWRIGVHFLNTGDTRSRDVVGEMNSWVQSATNGVPYDIKAGYWLDGDALPQSNYAALAYIAPFGVAAMTDSGSQQFLNELWSTIIDPYMDDDYFGDTIKLMTMIVMSENWWSPEAAPCP